VTRLLIAAALALVTSLLGTRLLIVLLRRAAIGQPIHEDVPEGHITKAGIPTMGGLAIVGGAVIGYVVSDLFGGIYTRSGIIVMLAIVGAGLVGLLDDWLKVSRERNLGLNKRAKTFGLLAVAIGFALAMVNLTDVHTMVSFTRFDHPGWDLSDVGWVVWAVLLIYATSNSVNLTDGLDGLAAGSGVFAFMAFLVVGFWSFRHPEIYQTNHALDLAIVAAAMLGACAGYLWWNAAPAQIIMGDTGSLAIGTALAALALGLNVQLLLVIVGAIYVAEASSVIIQVGFFKLTGKRVFRMAPIHHHFELKGWPDTWVIIRFWMFAGFSVALGLGIFYRDFTVVEVLP
jgi:phospho-N-acetylmuramoyl-pentapeptide-transferase